MKMTTYPGLTAATRESVSLDEDELSDVEDEVFIRDGRNGYKMAEERGVKRPLMAPRRKISKPDLASRLKNRPPCRMLCVPCCYAFIALTIFLGLIVVVIVLVAIFPLPLDTVKSWLVRGSPPPPRSVPCSGLHVRDVWSVSVPRLASESAMRSLDVNGDGVDDIVFGYGLGEDIPLPQQWFCPLFLNVRPPCQGGVLAVDGASGSTLWQRRLPHSVFTLVCAVAPGNASRCVAGGKGGVLAALSARDGALLWEHTSNVSSLVMDVYAPALLGDVDGDGVGDVLAAHTVQLGGSRSGFLLVISGQTGVELSRVATPNGTEVLYAPQLFSRGQELMVLFGTGSESTPGGLHMASFNDIYAKHMNAQTLYTDPHKGVLSPVVLVDLNGDQQDDIVSAMFNSTVVAIDGRSLRQLWNFTVNNSETLSTPTPGYFTSDNVTDFLVKYQTGPEFPLYYYSQTVIIDGKTGKPIYNRPMVDTVGSQMGGLTISMDNHGNDMFIYWMADCQHFEGRQDTFSFDKSSNIWQKSKADLCKLRFNSSMVTKLYSINQYNEPPGILLYTSDNRTALEFNNSKTPLEELNIYLQQNPDFDFNLRNDQSLDPEEITNHMNNYNNYKNMDFKTNIPGNVNNVNNNYNYKNMNYKGGISNFRHRDNDQGLVKDFSRDEMRSHQSKNEQVQDDKYDYDQSEVPWAPSSSVDEVLDPQLDYSDSYADDTDRQSPLNTNIKTISSFTNNNRDPRSKPQVPDPPQLANPTVKPTNNKNTKKKSLSEGDQYGPNDYKNIYMARNRLLHDLNDLPSEILRDTYIKNNQKQIRNNKFQQRDLRYREHEDEDDARDNKTEEVVVKKFPESLWDLESEKELEDRENGYWRGKRDVGETPEGIFRMTSTGLLLKPLSQTQSQNAIDLVFATYWVLPKHGAYVLLEKDEQCIRQKLLESTSPNSKYHNLEKLTKEDLFTKMCLEERGVQLKPNKSTDQKTNNLKKSPYYNQISQLSLGQMTIYRIRLECKCEILKPDERCSQMLAAKDQFWPAYMGKSGDGLFQTH